MLGKVLVVAIDRYRSCPLNGCLSDGEDMYSTLIKSVGYDPERIRYLANDQATKANILDGLRWLADAEFALCFYAGHGSLDNSGRHPILAPYDYDLWWHDPLSHSEINKRLDGMRGVIIYDCCHSGSLCSPDLDGSIRAVLSDCDCRERFLPNPNHAVLFGKPVVPAFERGNAEREARDLHVNDSGFIYISGCRDSETSKEARVDGLSRGLFSSTFCRLYRENPAMPVRRLWEETSAAIQERVDLLGLSPQHPQLWCRADSLDKPLFGELR